MSAQDSVAIMPEKNVEEWLCIENEDDKQTWTRYRMINCPCKEV